MDGILIIKIYSKNFCRIEKDRGMVNHLAYEDINFEICFVMYNIAALHADIAANEQRLELNVSIFKFKI